MQLVSIMQEYQVFYQIKRIDVRDK